jgi:hypothetical protein
MASFKSKLWWVLWSVYPRGSSIHQKCSNHTLTNLLFNLCKSMWIFDLFSLVLIPHLKALACPLYPQMLRIKEHIPTPSTSIVFHFQTCIWIFQGMWRCIIMGIYYYYYYYYYYYLKVVEQSSVFRLFQ